MNNAAPTTYFAAAYSGSTRIPYSDGPARSTPFEALGDFWCRSWTTFLVRAMDDDGERRLTDDECDEMGRDADAARYS